MKRIGTAQVLSVNSVNGKIPVRERLIRKLGKIRDSDLEVGSSCISDMVTCSVCGFLAKNARGLSIHMHKHKRVDGVSNLSEDKAAFIDSSGETDVSEMLEVFGSLLNRCRISVPLTRIIQKSVRIAVCLELSREIESLVEKNDVASWMRLLAFPYIVLCNKSKGKEGSIFKALSDVLRKASVPFKVDKTADKDSIAIKVAIRKVSEGAVRVLFSNGSVAPQTLETVSKLKGKHPNDNREVFEESNLECT